MIESLNLWLAPWSQSPVFYLSIATVLGLIVGSFLNVVIIRTPKMMEQDFRQECCDFLEINDKDKASPITLASPASTCPKCSHKIRAWENIPVISYLILKGRCSNCGTSISPRYPLIELASGLLSLLVLWYFGLTAAAAFALPLLWILIVLTMIDIDTQLLPDHLTLPLLWLGIIANFFGLYTDLESAVLGAIFGYLSLWSVYWLFKLVTGKEGMGYGDFKLLAALGAWMGWQVLPTIIILSSFVGAVIGIVGIAIQGRDKNIPIPFGPYLAIAGFIAFLWGDEITQTYLRLLA